MSILTNLLDKLRERQSWCPYCEQEYTCNTNCELKDLWFEKTNEFDIIDDMPNKYCEYCHDKLVKFQCNRCCRIVCNSCIEAHICT